METKYTQIYYSPIGIIKIVASDSCIEELVFIEEAEALKIEQSENIPPIIHQCTDELIEYFAGKRKSFSVPIHQEGTEFQQRV